VLHFDFETFSRADLPAVGAHRYAEDPSTEPLCVSVGTGDGLPVVFDLTQDPTPPGLLPYLQMLERGEPLTAHNAEFERSIMGMLHARYGWPKVRRSQFHCTAARSVAAGGPRSLNAASASAGVGHQKNPMGPALLKRFAMPQKDGGRIYPGEDPEAYRRLLEYCQQDVIVEEALARVLPPLHTFERQAFLLDSLLNDRGFPVDVDLISQGIEAVEELSGEATARVRELTAGINPSQRNAILAWVNEGGAELGTLQAQEVQDLLATGALSAEVREVLELRLETSRSALAKLPSMRGSACADGRVRGAFLYYGAHTGRWSGVRVQPHNFARGKPLEQDRVLDLLETGGADLLRVFYGNPLVALSQSIRGFIAPPLGRRWIVADYAAIEARVLAWLADEVAMLEGFRQGVDLYKWMAARIFGVSIGAVTGEQRRIGKNVILGCGYGQGGPGFVSYLARAGITVTPDFAALAVRTYRERVPNTVQLWYRLEEHVRHALKNPGKALAFAKCKLLYDGARLLVYLPSGRAISYPGMRTSPEHRSETPKHRVNEDPLVYDAVFHGKIVPEKTYGSKLVENIVQGISRDIMVEGMLRAEGTGYPVSLTVHDEVGADVPEGVGDVKEFEALLTAVPEWATGCPIGAEGYAARRYRKN